MTVAGGLVAIVLAVQVWDGFGAAAKAVFTWRMLHQWVLSERQGRSVLPTSFWAWSLLGSAMELVYYVHRRDPVFMSGTLVNAAIYARNTWLARWPSARGAARPWMPVLAGVALFAVVVVTAHGPDRGLIHFERQPVWLVVGFVGTLGWTARFVVQWWASERAGVAHLPVAFFRIGVVAAVFLFAYALSQRDWVNTVGFALTLVPYLRNLVLLRRLARSGAPGTPT